MRKLRLFFLYFSLLSPAIISSVLWKYMMVENEIYIGSVTVNFDRKVFLILSVVSTIVLFISMLARIGRLMNKYVYSVKGGAVDDVDVTEVLEENASDTLISSIVFSEGISFLEQFVSTCFLYISFKMLDDWQTAVNTYSVVLLSVMGYYVVVQAIGLIDETVRSKRAVVPNIIGTIIASGNIILLLLIGDDRYYFYGMVLQLFSFIGMSIYGAIKRVRIFTIKENERTETGGIR